MIGQLFVSRSRPWAIQPVTQFNLVQRKSLIYNYREPHNVETIWVGELCG